MTSDTLEQVRRDCEFRVHVRAEGFRAREVVPPGESLYDPQLLWAEDDGSVVLSDIGGQPQTGFDPNAGHGAIYRLLPDDRLEVISPPGLHGVCAPLRPKKAPPWFGPWGGHIFFVAQAASGRGGAHQNHKMYRVDPSDGMPVEFATLGNAGTIGDGIAAAGMTGAFGPEGSPLEGYLLAQSLGNCTIYRIDPDGRCEPYLTLDAPVTPQPMMPFLTFVGPDFGPWAHYAGEVVVATRPSTYHDAHDNDTSLRYWRIDAERLGLDPIPDIEWRPGPIAPASWGPYAGHMFTTDEGSTNLLHTTINEFNTRPLPYDARIIRIAPEGSESVFADQLQGGSTLLVFAGDRLLISSVRKSYSTGEYHEPDGSIYEIAPL